MIETRSGKRVTDRVGQSSSRKHFLPIDHNLHGAEKDKPEVRAVVHVHGRKLRPKATVIPKTGMCPENRSLTHIPIEQEPATLWYHDHAMGINRLNIYAGLFGMYLIRDEFEDALIFRRAVTKSSRIRYMPKNPARY